MARGNWDYEPCASCTLHTPQRAEGHAGIGAVRQRVSQLFYNRVYDESRAALEGRGSWIVTERMLFTRLRRQVHARNK